MYFCPQVWDERGERYIVTTCIDCDSRKIVRSRREMFADACATLGIHPFLSLHCKLNFSCIIVTEIISCRSVERVVERKRIHVLQEQDHRACFFGLSFFFLFFYFLSKNPYICIRKKEHQRKYRDHREGSSFRVDSASYTFPFGFIFLFYTRSLT